MLDRIIGLLVVGEFFLGGQIKQSFSDMKGMTHITKQGLDVCPEVGVPVSWSGVRVGIC